MKYIIKNKHWNIAEDYNKEKLLYLLIDRPTVNSTFGDFWWKNSKKQYHREYDLPANTGENGYVSWWKNDRLHGENNRPALICINGKKEYRKYNKYIKTEYPKWNI